MENSYPPIQDYAPESPAPTTQKELKKEIQHLIRKYNRELSGDSNRVELNKDEAIAYMYSTTTITCEDVGDQLEFRQTGPAPNYADGVFSLAACKRDLRRSNTFRDYFKSTNHTGIIVPKRPVIIIPYSSKYSGSQYAAGMGLITHGFEPKQDGNVLEGSEAMLTYKKYLLNQRSELVGNRITDPSYGNEFGTRFGDCYTEQPLPKHGHHPEKYSEYLNNPHIPILSDKGYSVAWERPRFEREYHWQNKKKRTGSDFSEFFQNLLVDPKKGKLLKPV